MHKLLSLTQTIELVTLDMECSKCDGRTMSVVWKSQTILDDEDCQVGITRNPRYGALTARWKNHERRLEIAGNSHLHVHCAKYDWFLMIAQCNNVSIFFVRIETFEEQHSLVQATNIDV